MSPRVSSLTAVLSLSLVDDTTGAARDAGEVSQANKPPPPPPRQDLIIIYRGESFSLIKTHSDD